MAYNFIRQKKSFLYFLLLLIISALAINSCKKDNKLQADAITDPDVISAKAWYDNTYPINKTSVGNSVSTLSIPQTNKDYSQFIKPDWAHSANYRRFNKKVIEMPVDPLSKVVSALRNLSTGKQVYKKEYSKTSFLILNDGSNYHAYIMMILADSAYIKNDLSKLSRTTYSKRDSNFTGMVLYFTPKGSFVSGWAYKNGKYVSPAHSASSTGKSVQSVSNGIKTLTQTVCEDWYLDTFIDDELVSSEYLYTTCSDADDGGGGGGTTPPPCSPVTAPPDDASIKTGKTISQVAPIDNPIDPTDPGGGGLPPPDQSPCTVKAPADTTKTPCNQINSLTANTNFNQLMNALNSTVDYNYETAYSYTINSNGTINAHPFQGQPGASSVSVGFPAGGGDGFIHSHNPGDFPTFSGADIKQLYQIMTTPGSMINVKTFTAGVITASGTSYMIKINDPDTFARFGAANFVNGSDFTNFLDQYDNNVNSNIGKNYGSITSYELALLTLLTNSGLTIFKGDSTFNSFTSIINQNGQVTNTNCNN